MMRFHEGEGGESVSDPDHLIELAMREVQRTGAEPVEPAPQNPIEVEKPQSEFASLPRETATQGGLIMLTWADIGLATEPSRYDSRHGVVEVTADDLWIWTKYPNAAFVLMQPSPYSEENVSRLGTFELREDWNVPQNERDGR